MAEKIPVTMTIAYTGMRVHRGKDWSYGSQDCDSKGKQTTGTITSTCTSTPDWCRVQWDGGGLYSYPCGGSTGKCALYHGELEEEERAPRKFKVGDRIKAIKSTEYFNKSNLSLGALYTVKQVNDLMRNDKQTYVIDIGSPNWIEEDCFEISTPRKFKVGDKVKAIKSDDLPHSRATLNTGGTYTVLKVDDYDGRYRVDVSTGYWIGEDCFEPYKPVSKFKAGDIVKAINSSALYFKDASLVHGKLYKIASVVESTYGNGWMAMVEGSGWNVSQEAFELFKYSQESIVNGIGDTVIAVNLDKDPWGKTAGLKLGESYEVLSLEKPSSGYPYGRMIVKGGGVTGYWINKDCFYTTKIYSPEIKVGDVVEVVKSEFYYSKECGLDVGRRAIVTRVGAKDRYKGYDINAITLDITSGTWVGADGFKVVASRIPEVAPTFIPYTYAEEKMNPGDIVYWTGKGNYSMVKRNTPYEVNNMGITHDGKPGIMLSHNREHTYPIEHFTKSPISNQTIKTTENEHTEHRNTDSSGKGINLSRKAPVIERGERFEGSGISIKKRSCKIGC